MEKERIRHREKSFLTGKKRMEKLKVLMKYAGISVFEYFPDADRLGLYDEQLKEERRMQPFLGRLEELCTVYPENREKLRGFLTGNIQGTVELKMLENGHIGWSSWMHCNRRKMIRRSSAAPEILRRSEKEKNFSKTRRGEIP